MYYHNRGRGEGMKEEIQLSLMQYDKKIIIFG